LLLCACAMAAGVAPPPPSVAPAPVPQAIPAPPAPAAPQAMPAPQAPPAPDQKLIHSAPTASLFRFVVYGDTRDGHAPHRTIVASVVLSRPTLVLQTGDLVADSSVASQWAIFDDITSAMRALIPYYPTRGNHDNEGGAYFEKYLPKEGVHRQ